MPQSLAAIYLHLVFSTRNRVRAISPESMADLHDYMGGIVRGLGHGSLGIGGVEDHVHLLLQFGREATVSSFVRDLKSNSSIWMKKHRPDFAWQAGYGIFSFSAEELPVLRRYVENQANHHASFSYQDELRKLLLENGLAWDERYLWD